MKINCYDVKYSAAHVYSRPSNGHLISRALANNHAAVQSVSVQKSMKLYCQGFSVVFSTAGQNRCITPAINEKRWRYGINTELTEQVIIY